LIAAGKVLGESLVAAKKKIKELWDQRKYGFTPSKPEADAIKDVGEKESYRRFKECVGNHWSIDLIRVGLYITELNDEGKKEIVKKIKDGVHRKYGARGIKIVELATTGHILEIIDYLSRLKINENLNEQDLSLEFEKLLEEWVSVTIFVQAGDNEKETFARITKLMDARKERFFVFAYGSAVQTASNAVSKIAIELSDKYKQYSIQEEKTADLSGTIKYYCIFKLTAI